MFLRFYAYDVRNFCDKLHRNSLLFLQDSEKDKIKRYTQLIDAKRSCSAQYLVKSVLSQLHNNIPLKTIMFTRTKENRPYWPHKKHSKKLPFLNFNVSHSGNWCITGIGSHCIIGVDVQELIIPGKDKSVRNFVKLMKDCFTFKELCQICLCDVNGKVKNEVKLWFHLNNVLKDNELDLVKKRFFSFWVLKEAFIKAIGCGVYFELNRVEFIVQNLNENDDLFGKKVSTFIDGKKRNDFIFKVIEMDVIHVAGIGIGSVKSEFISKSFQEAIGLNDIEVDHEEKIIKEVEIKRKKEHDHFDEIKFQIVKEINKFQIKKL